MFTSSIWVKMMVDNNNKESIDFCLINGFPFIACSARNSTAPLLVKYRDTLLLSAGQALTSKNP